jgi:hypothetical protein
MLPLFARIGSFITNYEQFMPWKTIEGEKPAPPSLPQRELLIKESLKNDGSLK